MGLFDSIKSVFGGSASGGSATGGVFVVDAEKLADSREGRTGPMERFRAIQNLSRFAEREKLEIIAVTGGRPLREVANGDSYNGVRVFYVEENSTMADQLEKTLSRARGRNPVVVTNDKQLETNLQKRGIATLRVSTLRKAFEGGEGGGERGERGDRGDRGERGDRVDRRQRRGPRPDRQRTPQDQSGAANPADTASGGDNAQPGDTVDGLIDRVN